LPVARRIGGLSDEERRSLADLLSVERELLDDVSIVVARTSTEDPPKALLDVLDALWVNQWRKAAESRLSQIVSQASAIER
jgi:hypothetical protein